jgi:hypothetical protein
MAGAILKPKESPTELWKLQQSRKTGKAGVHKRMERGGKKDLPEEKDFFLSAEPHQRTKGTTTSTPNVRSN